jgi:hypothetical protein
MLESNGSDYCLGDDVCVFMSHSVTGLLRHVCETSEETNYLMA